MRKAFALLLLTAVSCMPQRVVTRPDPATTTLAGQKLFRQHCSGCHGSEGMGTRYAPPLRSDEVAAMDTDALFRFVTNGDLRRGMPSWSRLPDERRWQIVAYLKSLRAPIPSAARNQPRRSE
jgi:mono/diheme cytochrome c family protein